MVGVRGDNYEGTTNILFNERILVRNLESVGHCLDKVVLSSHLGAFLHDHCLLLPHGCRWRLALLGCPALFPNVLVLQTTDSFVYLRLDPTLAPCTIICLCTALSRLCIPRHGIPCHPRNASPSLGPQKSTTTIKQFMTILRICRLLKHLNISCEDGKRHELPLLHIEPVVSSQGPVPLSRQGWECSSHKNLCQGHVS